MSLKKINYEIIVSISLFVFNVVVFFNSAITFALLFIVIFLGIYIFSNKINKDLLVSSFLFTNLVSAMLPSRTPYAGNQFAYFDHLYKGKIKFSTIAYSSSSDYLGFDAFSRIVLINNNLENLKVALFFVNIFAFYSIFRFYKIAFKNKNIAIFKILLIICLIGISLPQEFNSYMGFPKLFLNGTAGMGSFGLRILAPNSFVYLMFFPISFLLERNIKSFLISAIVLSTFHYYIFIIMVIVFVAYLASLKGNVYIVQSLLAVLLLFYIFEQYEFFQDIGTHLNKLRGKNVNFNLVPVISFGTIFNNGSNNNFIYYFDYEKLSFYKPEYLFSNFSSTLGVFNNEASIPFEKILLFVVSIYLVRNNIFLFNLLVYAIIAFFTSHYLFAKNILSFHMIFQPIRIIQIFSILCFMIIVKNVKIKNFTKTSVQIYLYLLLIIPVSYSVWKIYNPLNVSYNLEISNKIEDYKEEIILLPLSETKYVYHYNFPNIYLSEFPPTNYLNNQIMDNYFQRLEHYNNIYFLDNCSEIQNYLQINKIIIDIIFISNERKFSLEECNIKVIFFSDSI